MEQRKLKNMLARDVRNNDYELTDTGIVFNRHKITAYGVFDVSVNGEPPTVFSNLVTTEGLNHIVGVILGTESKVATWYIAPFAGNATPAAGWTAANFASNSTEFTNYTELTRQEYVDGSVSSGSISNLSSRAEFTIGSGAQDTIYGAGLLSASGKSATTGVLLAAARLSSARTGLEETDTLAFGYTFTFSDAG